MICEKCGADMPEGNIICTECGSVLKEPETAQTEETEEQAEVEKKPGEEEKAGESTSESPEETASHDEEQEKTETKPEKKEKKHRHHGWIWVIVLLLIIGGLGYVGYEYIFKPFQTYNDGIAKMNSGAYTEAIEVFETLEGNEEAQAMIRQCSKDYAISLINDGRYDDAVGFIGERDFNGSEELVLEARKRKLTLMVNDKQYVEAMEYLGTYEGLDDDGTLMQKASLGAATMYLDEGNNKEALNALLSYTGDNASVLIDTVCLNYIPQLVLEGNQEEVDKVLTYISDPENLARAKENVQDAKAAVKWIDISKNYDPEDCKLVAVRLYEDRDTVFTFMQVMIERKSSYHVYDNDDFLAVTEGAFEVNMTPDESRATAVLVTHWFDEECVELDIETIQDIAETMKTGFDTEQ